MELSQAYATRIKQLIRGILLNVISLCYFTFGDLH